MDAQIDLGQRAFGMDRPDRWERWRPSADLRVRQGAFLGAFASGRPAGSAMFHDMRQWWHGRPVPMAGVASVKIAPEYRGRGIGRRLMTELLGLIAGRGYPLSALYPATMPLYRSLGWELAGGRWHAVVPARSLRSLLPPDPAVGPGPAAGAGLASVPDLRRAGPDDVAAVTAVIGRAHEAARDSGPLTWDAGPAARWLARKDIYSYLGDEGFVAYRWSGGGAISVERVHGVTPDAVRALWSVIASHSSIADTVRARLSPADPLWWLTDERDVGVARRPLWMLRVVDAPAAIAARGFPAAVTASVPLVVADTARPANSGRWELRVSAGKGTLIPNGDGSLPAAAAARPGGASALTLGPRGLAALYAGTPVTALRLAGLASGGSPDSDAALDAAFAGTAFMLDDF
jgi:GNAT superfamily N-acetyltransferase